MTTRTFRPYEPDDPWLLPPSPQEWLPEAHLAYFLSDLVDVLNLTSILRTYGGVTRGAVPYHPRLLVKVLFYAYAVGIPASRQIARELEENVAFRVLAANQRPDFRTISDFRQEHLAALSDLFRQVLTRCQRAGLVKLGHIALDGTKLQANASKHKAMSYDRMGKEQTRWQAEVEALLQQAEAVDARDDATYGPDRRGDELPAELARREQRLETIRAAKAVLEHEAQAEATLKQAVRDARTTGRPRRGRPPQPSSSGPHPKAQRNFTDPGSRIMPASGSKGSFVQGDNCQAAVDARAQIIVAADVTDEPNDTQQAQPLLTHVLANTGQVPRTASLDAGYFREANRHGPRGVGLYPAHPAGSPTPWTSRARCTTRSPSGGPVGGRAEASNTADSVGLGAVRQAENHRGADLWADQAGARLPPVLVARDAQSPGGMGAHLYHPQCSQALDRPPASTTPPWGGVADVGGQQEGEAESPETAGSHRTPWLSRHHNLCATARIMVQIPQCRTGS